MPIGLPTSAPASARLSISAPERHASCPSNIRILFRGSECQIPSTSLTRYGARSVFAERRLDELHRVRARPFGRPGERGDLAAGWIDQQGRRHAEGFADHFQVLEDFGIGIGVVGEALDTDLLEPRLRL